MLYQNGSVGGVIPVDGVIMIMIRKMTMEMTMTMKIIMTMIMENLSASEITPNIQRMLTNMKFESAA